MQIMDKFSSSKYKEKSKDEASKHGQYEEISGPMKQVTCNKNKTVMTTNHLKLKIRKNTRQVNSMMMTTNKELYLS